MLSKGFFFSRIINKFWVSTQYVPTNIIQELDLDLSRPIIYVVQRNSASDLLGLQSSCLKAGLPDPYKPIEVNGQILNAIIFLEDWSLFSYDVVQTREAPYFSQYQKLLELHRDSPTLDVQLVPVSFSWGRNPGKDGRKFWFSFKEPNKQGAFYKAFIVMSNAKDHLVRFNKPISVVQIVKRGGNKNELAYKLARIALSYFGIQKRSSIGPRLPNRNAMIKSIIKQSKLQKIIEEIAQKEGITTLQVEDQCQRYLREISANFSYPFLRLLKMLFSIVWNKLYKGIEINNAESVRRASQTGAEIIYMPCHRSHADYLLMSYLLILQGLVAPHIAAGVNLNFFPAGSVFRRCGAFFLRRSFKGNPLYTQVFKAYFAMLFKQGYPIEFFPEGGRSRTGCLLPPQIGLLSISLQTYLVEPERNLIIIPVYIGYDHIMEVNTYHKEMAGQKKKKENAWQMLNIVKNLSNFGRVFVNFGQPINVKKYFDVNLPDWKQRTLTKHEFNQQVRIISNDVMIGINNACAVNALPFCALILLSDGRRKMIKSHLLDNIKKHQQLLSFIIKGSLVTYSKESPATIYKQALDLGKFTETENFVSLTQQQAIILSYYRNNIIHLFIPSAMICSVVRYLLWKRLPVNNKNIVRFCQKIYPLLQAEYFLDDHASLDEISHDNLLYLTNIGVLIVEGGTYHIQNVLLMNVLMGHIKEAYLRYQVGIGTLFANLSNWEALNQKEHQALCKKELQLSSIEPFDPIVNQVLVVSLKKRYPDFLDKNETKLLIDLFFTWNAIGY
ncbi:MAG: glycerol-3-phosphate 1-O-acyltransferase PlsB [Psychromonas sp.]|nr:glycerol-3-phosphate 1-O-acyltransferase PlsB [Psychromonas sp.]